MRIVANWLSDAIYEITSNTDLNQITKIISPFHLAQFENTASIIKSNYLVCKEITDRSLNFVSVDEKEIANIKTGFLCGNSLPEPKFNYLNLENILAKGKEPNLKKLLGEVKSIENKFNNYYQKEKLNEFSVSIKGNIDSISEPTNNGLSIKNGKHNLSFLLNKVKEIHNPDIFDTIKNFPFKKKRSDIKVPSLEKYHYQTLREQFQIDTTLAKHLSLISVCDMVIVETEEEYSHYSHILSTLDVDTIIIHAKQFKSWYSAYINTKPHSHIDFVKHLLGLINDKNWLEYNENHFKLNIDGFFLGFFNEANLIKNDNELNQLILSNKHGGFTIHEKKSIAKYLNSFLTKENIAKDTWKIGNLEIKFNPKKGGVLLTNFI